MKRGHTTDFSPDASKMKKVKMTSSVAGVAQGSEFINVPATAEDSEGWTKVKKRKDKKIRKVEVKLDVCMFL